MRQLTIYMNDHKAGVLTEQFPGKGYTFRYDEEYLSSGYPPISVTMPKSKAIYESEVLPAFFSNMIPEGANLGAICRDLRIDETDVFGILAAMAGKDFIGAVRIGEEIENENNN